MRSEEKGKESLDREPAKITVSCRAGKKLFPNTQLNASAEYKNLPIPKIQAF